MFWLLRLVLVGVLIMARGAPDDSNVKVGTDVFRLDDLAELAVRLGSIVTYNRYGSVLMLDGFEEGKNAWNTGSAGVGGEVEITGERAYNGQVCLKMVSGTGADPHSGMNKYLPPITECRIGLQTCFGIDLNVVSVVFMIRYFLPPYRYHFVIRYNHLLGVLEYESADTVWVTFGECGFIYDGSNNFHNMKMVVDMETRGYVRCSFNNVVYDMSSLVSYTSLSPNGPFLFPEMRVYGDGILSGIAYFDNVIVTYNEF